MNILTALIKKRIGLTTATILSSIVGICLTLYWNFLISRMIDAISLNIAITFNQIIISIVIILVTAINGFISVSLAGWTCESYSHDLRMNLAKTFMTMPAERLEEQSIGEVMSKLQNELAEISAFLRSNLFAVIEDAIKFIATFIWMLILEPKLTILSHIPIILILWYISVSSRVIHTYTHKSQDANEQVGKWIETLINLFPIIRIFQAEKHVITWHDNAVGEWEENVVKEERIRAKLMSLSAVLQFAPLILLFAIGGSDVIRGKMSLGTLYIFINLSANVSGVTINLPSRIAAFRRFVSNLSRMGFFIRREDSE